MSQSEIDLNRFYPEADNFTLRCLVCGVPLELSFLGKVEYEEYDITGMCSCPSPDPRTIEEIKSIMRRKLSRSGQEGRSECIKERLGRRES